MFPFIIIPFLVIIPLAYLILNHSHLGSTRVSTRGRGEGGEVCHHFRQSNPRPHEQQIRKHYR